MKIIENVPGETLRLCFEILNDAQKEVISSLLPLDLSTDISLSLSLSEEYWKRKCFEKQWAHMNYWLNRNYIEDEGTISIFQSLISNINLLRINLSCNQITSKSAFSLCMLLKRNKILKHVDLTGNNLGKEAGKVINKGILGNNIILYLGFQFCGFDEETEDLIHLHLTQNNQSFMRFQLC
ncbi:transposable element Hobo transposase-complex-associated testis-expressed protein 1 [Trichonephila clavata]|uniref:Transposable element Hobo transposase-complex-associated testis-expressed protein 1 n=1 Tax=Trichonephila clavata TaxID=2740835 RepID=A0A8X6JSI9_TRICU|nr:transposable element Hobo transposase-complex-associated testis-expressed protein 1 [Trichonephila clavata]